MGKCIENGKLKIFLLCISFAFQIGFLGAKTGTDYENYTFEYLQLKDFGAVGDGISDDSKAFIKALQHYESKKYTVLDFSGNFIYNLNNTKINLPKRLSLRFSGSVIKNAELIGDNSTIIADPIRIFDNVSLSGHFTNTNRVFVEWFGTFPNESSSMDLKKSLEILNKVFFSVSLNQGIYYTKIGNIDLKGIKGISPGQTYIEFQSNADDLHLFHVGKVKGLVSDRTYDNNYLKSVSLSLTSNKKIYNNTLLIIGACHQIKIDDVKFIGNSDNTSLTIKELAKISADQSKSELANVAIKFDGASELLDLNNIFTLTDIGIKFSRNTDFVNISNYTSWNGKNGYCTVYFEDTTISNVLFSGNQSWSQGLYGVYAQNATGYNNFVNVKFENIRIEQLNTEIKNNNKVVASSFYFGDYVHIPNLIIDNVMLAGTANGIRFGSVQDGRVSLNNISVFYDKSIPRSYALEFAFKNNGSAQLSLNNVELAADLPLNISNGNFSKSVNNNKFNNTLIQRK